MLINTGALERLASAHESFQSLTREEKKDKNVAKMRERKRSIECKQKIIRRTTHK